MHLLIATTATTRCFVRAFRQVWLGAGRGQVIVIGALVMLHAFALQIAVAAGRYWPNALQCRCN
jgi:hypothetical protein